MQEGQGTSGAGRSIQAILWGHLDNTIGELANGKPSAQDPNANVLAYVRLQGQAHAFSVAIATMRNPYEPPIDDVKAEARDRWTAARALR